MKSMLEYAFILNEKFNKFYDSCNRCIRFGFFDYENKCYMMNNRIHINFLEKHRYLISISMISPRRLD